MVCCWWRLWKRFGGGGIHSFWLFVAGLVLFLVESSMRRSVASASRWLAERNGKLPLWLSQKKTPPSSTSGVKQHVLVCLTHTKKSVVKILICCFIRRVLQDYFQLFPLLFLSVRFRFTGWTGQSQLVSPAHNRHATLSGYRPSLHVEGRTGLWY